MGNKDYSYEECKENNICPRCYEKLSDDYDYVLCPTCRRYQREYRRNRYEEHKKKGLCVACSSEVEDENVYCNDCIEIVDKKRRDDDNDDIRIYKDNGFEYTEEFKMNVLGDYIVGVRVKDIIEKYDINYNSLYRWVKDMGYDTFNDDNMERCGVRIVYILLDYFECNDDTADIADRYCISRSRVQEYIRKFVNGEVDIEKIDF